MTGSEFVNVCKADKCSTQSRSKNGQKYHNKYTEYFGKLGYKGINSKGVFTKRYSYGVVGHCCIGVQYHLHRNGMSAFVPKSKGYIWNTNVFRKWLMTNPNGAKFVTNPASAKIGAIAFKGNGKNKKSATHTCVFIKYEGNYVYTVDFNVSDGHGHNNGTLKKRHKKYFLGFANLPWAAAKKPNATEINSKKLETGKTYVLLEDMAIRTGASANANKVKLDNFTAYAKEHATSDGLLAKGTRITFSKVYQGTTSPNSEWVKLASGYMCAIGSTGKKFVELADQVKEEATVTASSDIQMATFPMKILRFSAIWNTSTPHKKCSGGSPKDYPTDLVGADTGRDMFYAPCDLVVLKVYSKASHGIWFRSKNKVKMPVGEGYLYMMAEHESVSGFKVNQTYKKGQPLFTENKYGNATGNHIHLSCGWSKSAKALGSGWRKNTKGAWVLYVPGVTNIRINEAFYVDGSFTQVRDNRHSFLKV